MRLQPVQSLIEAFGFGLLVRRRDRIWYNSTLARCIGRPVGSLQTIDAWFTTLYGEDAPRVRHRYETRRAAGFPEPVVISFKVPSGGIRHLSINGSAFGAFEVWVVADVTEQRSAEERYIALFEHSSHPHFIFVRDGVRDCNQAALDLLGFTNKEEFLNTHPAKFSPEFQPCGTTSAAKSKQVDAVAVEQGFHRFYWVHKHKDGGLIPVEVSLTQVHLADGPALLGVWHDLSEREAREAELEQARDQAEAGLASRNAFIATVSHELRTPMNGVLGLTEALLETKLDAEQRELADAVWSSGTTLRRLLDDILDFSKTEAGELQLESMPFSLDDTLNAMVELHREAARSKSIEIELEVPNETVCGDPTRLCQVLGNLISNGIKFTDDGRVRLSGRRMQDNMRFLVEDTGIGLSEAEAARIFEPFRQADASTTRRFGGFGLGLAIVDRLVKKMDGQIRVESRLGEGTRFELDLPLPTAASCNTCEEDPLLGSSGATGGLRILVAEDNAVNRMVVERALPEHELHFVEDGSLVDAAVTDFEPQLILMDVHMPKVDGLEATRRLRDQAIDLPIIALTASCLNEDRVACLQAGMNHVLHKPLDRRLLHQAIRRFAAAPNLAPVS